MGGRKTLTSGLVISSGYIPPVSSNRARRRSDSDLIFISVSINKVRLEEPDSHAEPLSNTREVPNWLDSSFTRDELNSRVLGALSSIGIEKRSTLQDNLSIDRDCTLPRGLIDLRELDVCFRDGDTGTYVQTTIDLFAEDLRDKMTPWIERDDLLGVKPG